MTFFRYLTMGTYTLEELLKAGNYVSNGKTDRPRGNP
jgi:hypothetical protein